MKRLILCCDGTWNTASQEENNLPAPTNVVKVYNALAATDADGNEQLKYYHPGVGTEGSFLAKTAGGIFGDGLDKNIQSGWHWLCRFFAPGDAIYLFGFSRGAYTARCIGGLVGVFGLPIFDGLAPKESWARIQTAYGQGYSEQKPASKWRKKHWKWREPGTVPVEFVGVWDTVGARGIPDDLALLNLLDRPENWRFYDTRLGAHVRQARHAVAMDERRASFTPTLWTDDKDVPIHETDRVKQYWFPGVHCDVGGGYSSCGLSDIALKWMIDEAVESGLSFVPSAVAQIKPDPRGVLHDSLKGVFKSLRSRPRNLPDLSQGRHYHPSALDRQQNPPITQAPYHRTRKLAVGEEASIPVYSSVHWNQTDLFLEEGATYEFTADGEWLDHTIACGPGGTADGNFQLGEVLHLAGTMLGKLEGVFHEVSGNKEADFMLTRRLESAPWFSLVGVIANDGIASGANPPPDGSPSPHQFLEIGAGPLRVKVKEPGYLFAFANDAWLKYENNRGSVQMKVRRRS